MLAADRPEEAVRLMERTLPRLTDAIAKARGSVLVGDAMVRLERYTEALEAYQTALTLNPNDLEPAKKSAELMIASGNADRALPIAEVVTAALPKEPYGWGLRARALSATGNNKEAEASYRRAMELAPADGDFAVALAELYLKQERVDDAREVLRNAAQSTQGSTAWLAWARLEEQSGNADQAESAYRSAVKASDDAATNFRLAQFLQRAAKLAEAESVLKHVDELNTAAATNADFSLQRGRSQEALATYTTKLADSFSGKRVPAEDRAMTVGRAVEAALESQNGTHRAARARLLLNQSRSELSEGTQALLETEIALAEDDLASAWRDSRRALEYLPEAASAHYLRGVVLARFGLESKALEEWETATAKEAHVPSHMALAAAALQRHDLETAEDHVATVLRDEPANLQALLVYARVLEQQGRLDAAEAILNRTAMVDPANVEMFVVAGRIALQRHQDGAALLAFEKALLFDRRSQAGIDGLLSVFSHGRPDPVAIKRLERMAAAPPSSAPLFEIAGRLYEMVGRKKDAKRALDQALAIDSGRPTTLLALWKLGPERSEAVQAAAASAPEAQAIAAYEAAVAKGDPSGLAANNLAFAYAERGQKLDRALELAVQAVQRIPSKAEPMDTLGFVLLKMRQYTAAADAFERALKLKPDTAATRQIRLHLADAYEASGMPAKANEVRGALDKPRS